jgi:hypothetical protein
MAAWACERGGDRHVFCREPFFALGADTQRSEHLITYAKRHTRERPVARALVGCSVRRSEAMIVSGVRYDQRFARRHDDAVRLSPILILGVAMAVSASPQTPARTRLSPSTIRIPPNPN